MRFSHQYGRVFPCGDRDERPCRKVANAVRNLSGRPLVIAAVGKTMLGLMALGSTAPGLTALRLTALRLTALGLTAHGAR
jgi:hypothetical protein